MGMSDLHYEDTADEPVVVYGSASPASRQIAIMLHETSVPVVLRADDGAVFKGAVVTGARPLIIDPDGPDGQPISVSEPGAALRYLARKTWALYGESEREKTVVDQWLFWEAGQLAPAVRPLMAAQRGADMVPANCLPVFEAAARAAIITVEQTLKRQPFLAGGYTIADIACFPWFEACADYGLDFSGAPALSAWLKAIANREAVKAATIVTAEAATA